MYPTVYLQGENAVCLADYCDLFRCDIVAGIQTAEFWDISLCLEEDMEDIKQRCQVVYFIFKFYVMVWFSL